MGKVARAANGRLLQGHGGANGYAQRRMRETVEELCRPHGEKVVNFLLSTMLDDEQPIKERVRCGVELLDRGYGRPVDRVAIAQVGGDTSQAAPLLTTAQLIAALTPALEHTPGIDLKRDEVEV